MSSSECLDVVLEKVPSAEASKPLADFITKLELAEILQVSPRTIERWIRLRELPAPVRLGRTSFFHLPSIEVLLQGRAVEALESLARPKNRRASGR
jgi:predicted DNA-binding transcriptional regulator AlpA